MSYTALYRKFRPQKFEDVKGQDHIVTTLKNQIRSEKIQHAYLFTGTRGTGKTSVAKLFAKAINCENPVNQDPCMECSVCRAIQAGASMNVVEIDAASNNGVDNIRQIIEEVAYPPTEGKYKVYIIDEVHMLSIGAFNALLKTLEEPPSYVIFILATTEVHKLPITILSRCQRYDFKRISVDDILGRINELLPEENLEADEDALRYVARTADGSLRDALSLLDQCIAFNFGKRLTLEMVLDTLGAVNSTIFSDLLRMIIIGDVAGAIYMLEEIIMEGREMSQFVTDFTWYIRNLLLAVTSDDVSAVVDMSRENLERLIAESKEITADQAMRYIRILSELSNQIRYATNKRVLVELAIIKMCRPEMEAREDTLVARIRELEKKIEEGYVGGGAGYSGGYGASGVGGAGGAGADGQGGYGAGPGGLGGDGSGQAGADGYGAGGAGAIQPSVKLPRPESVPDDVKKVAANWKKVIDMTPYPQKGYVKHAIPSLGSNGELIVAFEKNTDKVFYTEGSHHEEHLAELTDIVGEVAGAEVRIRLEVNKQPGSSEGTDFPDLTKLFPGINVLIEEEE